MFISLHFILIVLILINSFVFSNAKIVFHKSNLLGTVLHNEVDSSAIILQSPSRKLILRGGAAVKIDSKGKVKPQTKGLFIKIKDVFNQIKPTTRNYLFLTLFCTIIHITGLPAPAIFGLDRNKLYEVWRPFTAVAYLGPPSMSMANSLYFLLRYGQTLEEANGAGAHAWFLLVQTVLLSIFGLLLSFPFQAQAMIASIVYVCSRINAMEKIPIQFGLMITAWQLPYCMLVLDCLSQQKIEASWPHILGILSGHIYHFTTTIWPNLGGKPLLLPPQWWLERLGGTPVGSNIPGIDFRKNTKKSKFGTINNTKKSFFTSAKKGRKLD